MIAQFVDVKAAHRDPFFSPNFFIITTTIALVTADIIIALVTAIVSAASASHRAS
jgi:hypothetical protein